MLQLNFIYMISEYVQYYRGFSLSQVINITDTIDTLGGSMAVILVLLVSGVVFHPPSTAQCNGAIPELTSFPGKNTIVSTTDPSALIVPTPVVPYNTGLVAGWIPSK